MIEYEVTLMVDADIADAYEAWLQDHIREMLALPGFLDAELAELIEPQSPGRRGWCTRYRLVDEAALADYLRDHAAAMRADGVARFGDRFQAQRRVLRPGRRMALDPANEFSLPR